MKHKKEDTPVLNKNKPIFSFKLLFEISLFIILAEPDWA